MNQRKQATCWNTGFYLSTQWYGCDELKAIAGYEIFQNLAAIAMAALTFDWSHTNIIIKP